MTISDHAQCFSPLIGINPHTLILGSMPGRLSLERQTYYAHPRNLFWRFVRESLALSETASYDENCHSLVQSGIALWDVLAECERPGSLDSAIRNASIRLNDFPQLFEDYPTIRRVLFNGNAAFDLYRRHVLPSLSATYEALPRVCLPSTSPANAAISLNEKREVWCRALRQPPDCSQLPSYASTLNALSVKD